MVYFAFFENSEVRHPIMRFGRTSCKIFAAPNKVKTSIKFYAPCIMRHTGQNPSMYTQQK